MIVILICWSLIGFLTEIFAAQNESVVSNQLVYLFSSGVEEYDFRAANWSRFTKASDQEFAVLLFDLGKTELVPPHFQKKNMDYVILWSPFDGQVCLTGSGEEVEEILSAQLTASLATDVDESTWGKIKELFQ